jgi:uncharacterized protein
MPNLSQPRRLLCRFSLHFFAINILLSLLISVNYMHVWPPFLALADSALEGIFIWVFFAISFFVQMAILFFFCLLLVIVLLFISPRPFLVFSLSIILAAALVLSLLADSIVFHLFHMHYALLGWQVFKADAFSQVVSFSLSEKLALILGSLILLMAESLMAWLVWRHVKKKPACPWGNRMAALMILCMILSYGFNFIARGGSQQGLSANTRDLIVKATRFVPYYDDIYQLIMPVNMAVRSIDTPSGSVALQLQQSNRRLAYPTHDLQFEKPSPPLNLVVIVIDTWRYDAMNAKAMPHVYQFAQQSMQFQDHWSGGNSTQAGLFSFFYGLPANYWETFLQQKRGPLLIQQLMKTNYSMTIFSSASLKFPAFDQTIFRDIKPLKITTEGASTIVRDQKITQAFKQFLMNRKPDRPFFSFLFYDAAHNYCESTLPKKRPFKSLLESCNRFSLTKNSNPKPYMNRYLNAIHFIDAEIKQVLDVLEEQHLLKNTIIILTADHGEELNDNRSGYWQHASAYTSHQLHVPLLVSWPGKKAAIYKHFTTHFDVVPTLMTGVLNCKNPLTDYTLGQSLFSVNQRPPLISGSYADYAVVTKDQVARVYHYGDYVIDDAKGSPLTKRPLQIQSMRQAFNDLNAYLMP